MRVELIVGLGNLGREYEATRHNAGFRVVDEVARRLGALSWEVAGPSLLTRPAGGRRPWLAKPVTFMNRSGRAGMDLLDRLVLEPEQMLVVCDDVDLDLGRLRLRRSGGPGTHNGLRDLVACVGRSFPRLRLGVGREDSSDDLADYVLSPFADSEQEQAREVITRAADAVEAVLKDGLDEAMGRFNRAPEPSEPAPGCA
jgi:PTH1 family peptidyl-tRNA hydrolase